MTRPKSTAREYYEALLIAVVFVNFARVFLFQAFKIPTGSMYDNLLVGDHIIVNKFIYGPGGELSRAIAGLREVRRGDVLIFRYPRDRTTDFVKRVIGLPGETIWIRDKQVFINGQKLDEPYVLYVDSDVYEYDPDLAEPYRSRDQFGPYRIPADSYFVMGDNRDVSHDSRYWGSVRRELVKGKAFLVYWSFDAQPPPVGSPPIERFRELANVAIRFFPDTRWERTFHRIDAEYQSGGKMAQ